MNLLSVLMKVLLADAALSALSGKTGISAYKLKKLIPLALPLLLRFMTSNASSQSGVLSLLGALRQHTDTKALPLQLSEADEEDGGKIVRHILGDETEDAVRSLARQTGMSENDVNRALGGIAPALLSALASATVSAAASAAAKPATVDLSDGFDMSDLMAMLSGTTAQPVQQQSSLGGGLLDMLLGGGMTAQPVQQQPSLGGSLLGSLLGGSSGITSQGAQSSLGSGLLGALLGGGATTQPVQQQPSLGGSLLGSLLGGQQVVQPVQQTSASSLLGSLASGAISSSSDNSMNGTSLLGLLMSALK